MHDSGHLILRLHYVATMLALARSCMMNYVIFISLKSKWLYITGWHIRLEIELWLKRSIYIDVVCLI